MAVEDAAWQEAAWGDRDPYAAGLLLLIAGLAVHLGLVGFFVHRRNAFPVRQRGWPWVLCSAFFGGLQYVVMCFIFMTARRTGAVSCHTFYVIGICFIWGFGSPILFRAFHFQFQYKWHQEKMFSGKKAQEGWYGRHRFLDHPLTYSALYVGVLLLCVAISAPVQYIEPWDGPYEAWNGCFDRIFYILLVQGGLLSTGICVLIYLCWDAYDAFGIKTELKMGLVLEIPLFLLYSAASMGVLPPTVHRFFAVFAMILTTLGIQMGYPLYISYRHRSTPPLETEIELIETGKLTLEHIMADPEILEQFRTYCVESWCSENLMFKEEVEEFNKIPPYNTEQREQEARRITERFIVDDAPCQVNLPHGPTEHAIQSLADEQWDTNLIFEPALFVVEGILRSDTLHRWMQKYPAIEVVVEVDPMGRSSTSMV